MPLALFRSAMVPGEHALAARRPPMPHERCKAKMGTRSTIIAKLTNGQTKRIYVHWDGYPEHNGRILLDHYTDQAKIDALIALGDLSSLGEEIGEKHAFDDHKTGGCTAYGRDRDEVGTKAKAVRSVKAAIESSAECGAEFVYLWNGQSWSVTTPEGGVTHPLREFMKGGLSLEQTVKACGGNFQLGKRTATARS
jgi:hypothetical protein